MNSATPIPWPTGSARESVDTTFQAIFERSPFPVARCNSGGLIIEMNPAFGLTLNRDLADTRPVRLSDLVGPQDRDKTQLLLADLLAARRDSVTLQVVASVPEQAGARWTAWRQPGNGLEADHIVLIAEPGTDTASSEKNVPQTRRWEAIGRLAGGAIHDFNNLLTGVTLYCDLLLSSLDARDHRRRYANEIRSASLQASGLIGQLLLSGGAQARPPALTCLNQVINEAQEMLSRLIGKNIVIELQLEPELEPVKLDGTQAQQILQNLVLNARDALPRGGRITVQTRNCRFESVGGTAPLTSLPPFPCVLLQVWDNGFGMSSEVRRHLFEPFFTTKQAGKGTGLGLNTVRRIVTSNQGLIHIESEPGCGTRVMVLFPQASQSPEASHPPSFHDDISVPPPAAIQEIKKELLL